jgi:hypothetical protein
MSLEIEKCLNESNRDFYYCNVDSKLNVNLISSNVDDHIWWNKCRDSDIDVTIIAGNDYPNPFSFSHEMLHLYLFANGFSSFGLKLIDSYPKLSTNLINHEDSINDILNVMAHPKMIPIFTNRLRMPELKFFAKRIRLVHDVDIDKLKHGFNPSGNDFSINFTNYLRFFFYSRYNCLQEFDVDYLKYNSELKEIDNQLFDILDKTCSIWDKYPEDYNNIAFFYYMFSELEKYL